MFASAVRRWEIGLGLFLGLALGSTIGLTGQQAPAGRQGGPPPTPQAQAPFDMTGTWVSLVFEDWRWRMMTPPRGDFAGVLLTPAGIEFADSWDMDADKAAGNECRPYGVGGVFRLPGRLRISWQDESTLKIETSAGTQTRLLRFNPPAAAASGERTWQGTSVAAWQANRPARGFAGGNLKVTTTGFRLGYLRPNGIPYSENASITEYYNRHDGPGTRQWLTIIMDIQDPLYHTDGFVTSTDFLKEPDDSKFSPTPCDIARPRLEDAPLCDTQGCREAPVPPRRARPAQPAAPAPAR